MWKLSILEILGYHHSQGYITQDSDLNMIYEMSELNLFFGHRMEIIFCQGTLFFLWFATKL